VSVCSFERRRLCDSMWYFSKSEMAVAQVTNSNMQMLQAHTHRWCDSGRCEAAVVYDHSRLNED